jgi:hypothetical protein
MNIKKLNNNEDPPERPEGHSKGCKCDICIIIDEGPEDPE